MDETNTANSSSAAAVADGASAAAHTKTVGVAPIKSASHVKLLIKSSNQQYEDHVVESDMLWTVKRLKSHLSIVYPSKPPVAEQKLIYSGQLLSDNVQLKDVIRSYKDVYTHNHIIHLVYTPKNFPITTASTTNKTKPSLTTSNLLSRANIASEGNATRPNINMPTTDGLRQRHTAAENSGINQPSNTATAAQQQHQYLLFHQQMHPYFMATGGAAPPSQFWQNYGNGLREPYNFQAMLTQQNAMHIWMQQVYSQYMNQYLGVENTVNNDTAANTTYPPVFSTLPPYYPQLFQQQFPSTVMQPVPPEASSTPAPAVANLAADDQIGERQDQQQEAALAQVAAGRFPNLPQDEQDNRDWLDNFFSITRFALFLTLLYFNSSPLRCFLVVVIAGGIYLYHIGVFRLRHERNNNNLNRNNNAAQNAAVDQIRQGVDQQQNAAAAPDRQAANENNIEGEQQVSAATDTAENINNESMLSTMRTFVVTFFTSLLPETPAL